MKIIFDSSEEAILKSVEITREFLGFLKERDYDFYFPFSNKEGSQDILEQVAKDKEKYNFEKKMELFGASWNELEGQINQILQNNKAAKELVGEKEFLCRVTMYGPSGYFEEPDTVYVNVTIKDAEHWMETLLHEVLHLWIDQEKKYLPHEKREALIDDLFISLFGRLFPNYQKQK